MGKNRRGKNPWKGEAFAYKASGFIERYGRKNPWKGEAFADKGSGFIERSGRKCFTPTGDKSTRLDV